jgi:molybdopterin synthase catalytic subunit
LRFSGICKERELSVGSFIENVFVNKKSEVGAIACFFGVVRGFAKSGKKVKMLEIEAYKMIAEKAFYRIAEEIKKEFEVTDVHIGHVAGKLDIGDLIMAIAITAPSRSNVFPALKKTVEKVKSEATLWKKEYLVEGESYWIQD